MSDLLDLLMDMEIALSSPWAEAARKAHDEIARLRAENERLAAVRAMCIRRANEIGADWSDSSEGGERSMIDAVLSVIAPCPKCVGTGTAWDVDEPMKCDDCNGDGHAELMHLVSRSCKVCLGHGRFWNKDRGDWLLCEHCDGSGVEPSC